jgi:hypothetical protein
MAEFKNQRFPEMAPDTSDDPMSGFNAMGKPVPFYRRQAGFDTCRRFGIDSEGSYAVVNGMSEQLERDKPYEAMAQGMQHLDLTGTYRLLAVLLTAEQPSDSTLIARLEAATEGSRELSDEALLACGWRCEPEWSEDHETLRMWYAPGELAGSQLSRNRPDPTRSIDDAERWMVPEGALSWEASETSFAPPKYSGGAKVHLGQFPTQANSYGGAALALTIAALKARQAYD